MFSTTALGAPLNKNVNVTGLKTALWRCDLGAELPLVAGSSCSDQRENLNLVPSLTRFGESIKTRTTPFGLGS
jgi:hypothetical protein